MKTCLAIVGGAGCLGVIIIVIIFAIFIPRAFHLEHGATAYIKRAVPAIVAHWDAQQLLDRATPKLQQLSLLHRGKLHRLFTMFRELGHLQHLGPPNGSVYSGTSSGGGNATTGSFVVPAKSEKGRATIQIQLLRTGSTWKINSFFINSDVFLPQTSTVPPAAQGQGIPGPPTGVTAVHHPQ